MKRISIILFLLLMSVDGSVYDMDNGLLLKAFNGWPVVGFSEEKLKEELSGVGAKRVIDKCKSDVRLREFLPSFPHYLVDSDLKDELIGYILDESSVWRIDGNAPNELSIMQASVFARQSLGPTLLIKDGNSMTLLSQAMLRREDRFRISKVFHEVAKIPKDRRLAENPEMAELMRTTQRILSEGESGHGIAYFEENPERLPLRESRNSGPIDQVNETSPKRFLGSLSTIKLVSIAALSVALVAVGRIFLGRQR